MSNWVHRLTEKDLLNRTAICSICGPVNIKIRGKKRSVQCRNSYNACRRGVSVNTLPKPSVCPICLKDKKLVLDHKHGAKVMRGWICQGCNSLIGFLREDADRMMRMSLYLKNFENNS